ncbi:MAG: competence/damage-inducible protein A [Planctomycetota bacterium]
MSETRSPVARVLSIGDEITSGLTVDTNTAWFSRELASLGVRVVSHESTSDDQPAIEAAIKRLARGTDLLVISGGIGPTPDDLTREALAAVVGQPVVISEAWIDRIRQIWAKRGKQMPDANRKQAGYPEGTELLDNPVGTAAGVLADVDGCRVVVVPGVPKEAKAMFDKHVRPLATKLAADAGGHVLRMRALHTFGLGESDVAERLGPVLERGHFGDELDVGTTASSGVVSVRCYARAETTEHADKLLDDVEATVREKLGHVVFGTNNDTLPSVLVDLLKEKRQTLVTAESCTGGLIAKLVTDVSGSSAVFDRAFVTYTNDSKAQLVGVDPATIEEHGAVSTEVVEQMATGALKSAGDVALSVSGVAGPGGGTEAKPVGTVCIGIAWKDGVAAKRFGFHGDREMVRLRSALMALGMLRRHLLGLDPLELA